MIDINLTKQRNTAQKSVHYMPTMRLRDNLRIGMSYNHDGSTQAKGTLYPYNMNNASDIGSVSSMYSTEYAGTSDWDLDNESFTNNEVKFKTGEAYFQLYKRLKGVNVAFLQQQLGLSSASILNSGRLLPKAYALSSTTFVIVYMNSGGTTGIYAVVGTVNATTGAVTYGTPQILCTATPNNVQYFDFTQIDTTKFVLAFHNSTTTFGNVCFTVSGTTITAGTQVNVTITNTSSLNNCSMYIEKASTSAFMVAFSDNNSGDVVRAYYATVSGTAITAGTATNMFGGTSQRYSPMIAFTSSTAGMIACYDNTGNLRVQPFTVSGTTITPQTESQISTNNNFQPIKFDKGRLFVALSNGWFYAFSGYSVGGAHYYMSVSGGVATIVDFATTNVFPSVTYSNASDAWQISANEWCMLVNVSQFAYLLTFSFDTGTQRMNTVRRDSLVNPYSTSVNVNALVKVGTQYVIMGAPNTTTNNLFNATLQEGSAELRFEGEVSAFATINNPKWGWAYARSIFNKTLSRTVAYLSIKNVTGNTVQIKTTDWFVEVE